MTWGAGKSQVGDNADHTISSRPLVQLAYGTGAAVVLCLLAGCSATSSNTQSKNDSYRLSSTAGQSTSTTTTAPCQLSVTTGSKPTVPVHENCSSTGSPHFTTPQDAMAYLATAWNNKNVRDVDYVTDPSGRAQLNSMAAGMTSLKLATCRENKSGDYTCFFEYPQTLGATTTTTTPTTSNDYPPGDAVVTVAPATGPGWYLTVVTHCN